MDLQPKIYETNIVRLPAFRGKRKLFFKPKPGTWLLLIVTLYVAFSFARVELQLQQTENQLSILKQRTQQLQLERLSLEKQQYQLLHDENYIEGLARNYLMIKPGEKLLMPSEPGEILPLLPEAVAEEKRD